MYKILLVDDEPIILEGLKRLINWEEYGIEVAGAANNGYDALQFIQSNKVNILLTDIKMPVINGIELIKKVISSNNNNIKFIVLSGYDDFEYVKESLKLGIENYLLKPVNKDELSATLLNTVARIESDLYAKITQREGQNVLKHNVLNRLITESIGTEEFEQKALIVGLNLDKKAFTVCTMKILSERTSNASNLSKDKSLLHFAVQNICSEVLAGAGSEGEVFCSFDGNIVFLLMHDGEICKEDIKQIVQKCIDSVNQYLEIDVFASIGSSVKGFLDIKNSYIQAKELLNYYLVVTPNKVLDFDDAQISFQAARKLLPLDAELEMLKNLIAAGKKESAEELIDEIFKKFIVSTLSTSAHIKSATMEILFIIRSLVKDKKVKARDIIENMEYMATDILVINDIEIIRQNVKKVAVMAINCIQNEESYSNQLVRQVLQYIHQNINKELSLKELSYIFNINAAYLGQQFKAETGELFSNYVTGIKIEKSKQLLRETHLKTNEIAEKIGFSDVNYFYRAFKKVVGISPSEYRNSPI